MDITDKLPRLKGEQCEILYLPRHSNQIILGVAGSGKSIEAICRATWIGMTNPHHDNKVVVLTFNRDVNEEIHYKLKAALSGHDHKVYVNTIYSYCRDLINKYPAIKGSTLDKLKRKLYHKLGNNIDQNYRLTAIRNNNEYHDDDDALAMATNIIKQDTKTEVKQETKQMLIQKGKQELNQKEKASIKRKTGFNLWDKPKYQKFINSEIQWMQNNNMSYEDKNQYLKASRRGRNNEYISSQQRDVMFQIYHQYYDIRFNKYKKLFNYADIYRLIPDLDIPDKDRPKYIVIDEVQDGTPSMFKALRHVRGDKSYWNVFGDLAQNIFGQSISWKQALGITIPKIYRLRKNYRNSYEIGMFAKKILDHIKHYQVLLNHSVSDMDEPDLSKRHGSGQHINSLASYPNNKFCNVVDNCCKHYGSTAIICMDPNDVTKVIHVLRTYGKHYCTNLDNYLKYHNVFVQSIYQIKGMEFNNVIIYGMDMADDREDRQEIINDDGTLDVDNMNIQDKLSLAERVYVSVTRARNNLLLLYKDNPLKFLF